MVTMPKACSSVAAAFGADHRYLGQRCVQCGHVPVTRHPPAAGSAAGRRGSADLHERPVLGEVRARWPRRDRPARPRPSTSVTISPPPPSIRSSSVMHGPGQIRPDQVHLALDQAEHVARSAPPGHGQRLPGGDGHLGRSGRRRPPRPSRSRRRRSAASGPGRPSPPAPGPATGSGTTPTRTPVGAGFLGRGRGHRLHVGVVGQQDDLARRRCAWMAASRSAVDGELVSPPGVTTAASTTVAPSASKSAASPAPRVTTTTAAGRSTRHRRGPGRVPLGTGTGRGLVGEAGDRDPVRPAGPDAGLDRRADVVDVHVHVPGRRPAAPSPVPTTTSESPSPASTARSAATASSVGVEQVLHLVLVRRRPGLPGVAASRPGPVPPGPAARSAVACPVTTSARASSSTTRPRPPASTTPARASTGKLFRRTGERLGGRPRGRLDHRGEVVGVGGVRPGGARRPPPTARFPRPARRPRRSPPSRPR